VNRGSNIGRALDLLVLHCIEYLSCTIISKCDMSLVVPHFHNREVLDEAIKGLSK
jgi:hypothetical protein